MGNKSTSTMNARQPGQPQLKTCDFFNNRKKDSYLLVCKSNPELKIYVPKLEYDVRKSSLLTRRIAQATEASCQRSQRSASTADSSTLSHQGIKNQPNILTTIAVPEDKQRTFALDSLTIDSPGLSDLITTSYQEKEESCDSGLRLPF